MNSFKLALILLLASSGLAQAKPIKIKFATLAPEGSSWMKVLRELDKELKEKTKGRVMIKFYAGGISGDEKDVVRKIRIGQLHAAAFTGVGIGEIAPSVRILDSPWLFKNAAEVDHIYKTFDKEFQKSLDKAGYVLLGWTKLGSVYVFSNKPFMAPEDMKKAKMWVWEGDPIAAAAYKAVGVSPIPLSMVDVMSSLQTGMIDAVYAMPMGAVALQWFSRTKYIYPVPMAEASGAVLISKKAMKKLTPEDQKILRELSAKHLAHLNAVYRMDNAKAMKALQKKGLTMTAQPGAAILKRYEQLGATARQRLAGKLYSADLLRRVESSLAKFRKKKPSKKVKRPKK